MSNRTGSPAVIWSDNKTNFKGADNKELKQSFKEFDQSKINQECTRRDIA